MTAIVAPFTLAQVEQLNRWQMTSWVHPFTCANRGDGNHRTTTDLGVLVAARSGWFCPDCDYKQSWAHDFMAGPTPPNPLAVPPGVGEGE